MHSLTRRQFLQISAATFGAAAAATSWQPLSRAAAAADAAGEVVETVATTCDVCFWKCGAIAYRRNGKLWKIEGNPKDLLSRGRLCTRGTGGIGAALDPDRLRAPLIRTGPRGKEQWRVATWDEALDFTARKLQAIAAADGPEAIAMFKHGISAYYIEHALKAFGTPNVAAPSFAQCRGPRDVGFQLTFGASPGSPESIDIVNSRCIVLIGSHLGENMHNSQAQEFAEAVGRGATVIAVDPRFSVAASKAKFWLPIKPGTDTALLLAWMRVIVTEQRYDREFVSAHGEGFEKFAAELAPYTPEWAAGQTDLPAEQIVATAREMAMHRPATLIHPGRRSAWYGNDTQRGRAVALLNALMGNWGRRGGFYLPSYIGLPDYPGVPKYPKSGRGKADNPGKRWPFADQTVTTGLREATITGKPYPIKAWVVVATNLLQAMPSQAETLKAIDALDLLVVVDTVPSEIASYADVVLPESVYLERHDTLNDDCLRLPFLALRQPVVAPPHEQKPGWWIGRELGHRLGVGAYFPWKDMEDCLRTRITNGGFDWEALKRDGIALGPKAPTVIEDGAKLEFDTPSGKVEFWSKQLADKGLDPVPRFVPPAAGPAGALRLVTGRAPMHTFSRTQSNPLLSGLMPDNEVWIHADVARELGLASGDYVKLTNQDGIVSDRVRVKATQRLRRDCAYMVHGFGLRSPALKGAYRRGASTAQLASSYVVDPIMGATSVHTTFVKLAKEA